MLLRKRVLPGFGLGNAGPAAPPGLAFGAGHVHNARLMVIGRRFLIAGRVQGVGFRFFVNDRARLEGVHGYVRNLADGRVEVVIEGDEEAVERMERALRRGPAGAHVDSVTVEPIAPAGRPIGFSIR